MRLDRQHKFEDVLSKARDADAARHDEPCDPPPRAATLRLGYALWVIVRAEREA